MKTLTVAAVLSALLFTACGEQEVAVDSTLDPTATTTAKGGSYVEVQGLSATQVNRIVVTSSPENTTQTLSYDRAKGAFSGYLVLSAGAHTLNATAYFGDAGVAGTGTADVTVPAGGSAAVSMNIYDATAADTSNNDIAPIIRSFTASKVNADVGETIQVAVDAVDLDGDALHYTWADDCGGQFGSTTASATTWSKNTSGACMLKITVASGGQADAGTHSLYTTKALWVQVAHAADGTASVSGQFVGRPRIDQLTAQVPSADGSYRWFSFYRYAGGPANLWEVPGNQVLYLSANITNPANITTTVTDNCGGTGSTTGPDAGYTYNTWVSPAVSDGGVVACALTTTVSNGTFEDSFTLGVEVR